jgi:hypothetical protein
MKMEARQRPVSRKVGGASQFVKLICLPTDSLLLFRRRLPRRLQRQCIIGVYTLMMIGTGAGSACEFASGLR